MSAFILAIALVALLLAVATYYQLQKMRRQLHLADGKTARNTRKLETVEADLVNRIEKLNYTVMKESGRLVFHEEMTFKEALEVNPRAEEVMARMHVGGCPDCAVDLNETLSYGAAKNNVNVKAFLVALNNLESDSAPMETPEPDPNLNVIR